jgi:PiT family inorganic phosphate transporter
MTIALLVLAALLVAFANGANDNAKGIATLVGSGMARMKPALGWANLTTFLGAVAAVPMALYVDTNLVKSFGGGGLLPKGFAVGGPYLLAVGLAAAATVLLATRLGIPISTTHALTGALVGAGLVAVGPSRIVWSTLGAKLVLPLLLSPVLAACATMALYPAFRGALRLLRVEKQLCLCVEETFVPVVQRDGSLMLATGSRTLTIDEVKSCQTRFAGEVLTISAQKVLAAGQVVTSGLVSFARGLNDTPKIVGILVAAGAFAVAPAMGLVAILMLLGGLLFTRRVARTVSERITAMDGEQGFVGSLVTAVLVFLASYAGLPVSTTHVAVGALFGIGMANGTAERRTIAQILAAWVTTLPLAAALAAGIYAGLGAFGA